MKKAGYIVSAVGVTVVIFAIVCFISAGSLLSELEQYVGMIGGYMDAGDLLDLALASGFDAGGFSVFAYQARVWLLVVGLVSLAAGVALIFIGRKNSGGMYGKQYMPAYGGYDEYDDARVAVSRKKDRNSVVCPACGEICSQGAAFCRNCGAALSEPEAAGRKCHACGAENDDDAVFCCGCGQKLDAQTGCDAPSAPEKNDWEAFRPERETCRPEESADAPEKAEPSAAESGDVSDEAAPAGAEAETVRMDTLETTGTIPKPDASGTEPGDAKPVAGNPFLRKAGDL